MSRRSNLSTLGRQQRAASRMTPGTSMWSEQMFANPIMRPAKAAEPDVAVAVDPEGYVFFDSRPDVSASGASIHTGDANTDPGDRWILVVSVDPTQGFTLDPSWQVLSSETLGGMHYAVITKKFTTPGSVLIASTGPETHSFNRLAASGFVLKGGTFQFEVNLVASNIGNPVNLHSYQGKAKHRLRALVGRGFYAWWETPGSGHRSAGYLTPETAWFDGHGYGLQPIEPYFTAPWPTGSFQHATIGVAGPLTWAEIHIGLVP